MTIAWFGWLATAVFATSYFVPRTSTLMKIQAAASCLWIIYGVKLGAIPIVVANLIVAGAALFSSFRKQGLGQEKSCAQDGSADTEQS
ncbi:MAG TPA: hypothetical protein VMU62_05450 [Acidobacteriaceae bacterium]|nr:hypothetical protein [Acidobacteriaceae bacterium]